MGVGQYRGKRDGLQAIGFQAIRDSKFMGKNRSESICNFMHFP